MGSTVWDMRRGVARTTRLLQQTPGEKKVASVLQSALTPSKLSVKDISGKQCNVDSPVFVLRVLERLFSVF